MEEKNFLKELLRPENKKARLNIFTAFVVGVLLLMMGKTFFVKPPADKVVLSSQKEEQSISEGETDEKKLEKRMKSILSRVEGAGEVDVMITLEGTASSVVARDEKSEASTITEEVSELKEKTTQSQKLENTVVMSQNGDGGTTPLILSSTSPTVSGVVIVAQGGGDALVQSRLMSAAQALLNVPAHKVAILKMK